ncbi:MAG: hypothetical protein JG781_2729 [Peptococcaceae bacterium]|jgi:hypothetical protein|nr:hypothetical protein [Peptococcaceae bacterium]
MENELSFLQNEYTKRQSSLITVVMQFMDNFSNTIIVLRWSLFIV